MEAPVRYVRDFRRQCSSNFVSAVWSSGWCFRCPGSWCSVTRHNAHQSHKITQTNRSRPIIINWIFWGILGWERWWSTFPPNFLPFYTQRFVEQNFNMYCPLLFYSFMHFGLAKLLFELSFYLLFIFFTVLSVKCKNSEKYLQIACFSHLRSWDQQMFGFLLAMLQLLYHSKQGQTQDRTVTYCNYYNDIIIIVMFLQV